MSRKSAQKVNPHQAQIDKACEQALNGLDDFQVNVKEVSYRQKTVISKFQKSKPIPLNLPLFIMT